MSLGAKQAFKQRVRHWAQQLEVLISWLALNRPGAVQAIGGLILGLIALCGLRPTSSTPPMTTSLLAASISPSSSNGESFASLPR
ncbi:MAG: hypothetical protein VKI42_01545 [Synechococcaceae cyanobacterium]|nr:hypothetical protein [Synechococcaceae cyanobacterium]